MNGDRLDEFKACLALKHCPGIGPRTWGGLLGYFGSALAAASAASQWRSKRLVRAPAIKAFADAQYRDSAQQELEQALAGDAKLVLWSDSAYPARLRMIADPPLYLYCHGRLELLKGASVAVVGSRKCSPTGMARAAKLCRGLSASGVTVVSGMAWGIDREAHLGGLSGPGSSVAVLGTGIDRVYPSANVDIYNRLCREGLVLTEFAPGTRPEAHNFPYRNRIVSGLSLGVVVVEAAQRSGTRITARLALEQGREVYAVPGPHGCPSFEGCRDLMEEGAMAVSDSQTIMADLAVLLQASLHGGDIPNPVKPSPRKSTAQPDSSPSRPKAVFAAKSNLDQERVQVLQALDQEQRVHIDTLARTLDWECSKLSSALLWLEVEGRVRQWPGMHYTLA